MKEIKLYQEIKNEVANVMEAEANSAAWKQEARTRMKDVSALITAAKKVNKGVEIDAAALIKEIRAEIEAEQNPAEDQEEDTSADQEGQTPEVQ